MDQDPKLSSLLYELSLSALKNEDPRTTARKFLKKLLTKKILRHGAIWKYDRFEEDWLIVERIYATSKQASYAKVKLSAFNDFFSKGELAFSLRPLFPNKVGAQGKYGYCKLGDFGMIELFDSRNQLDFNEVGLHPFLDLFHQLGETLEDRFENEVLGKEIQARKKTDRSKFVNDEKYRRIIDNIKLGLLEVDQEETIQYANEPFLELTGYKLEELIGKNATDIFFDKDDHEQRAIMAEQNDRRTRKEVGSYEVMIKHKKGERRWAIISGSPNYDDEGNLIGSIGIHLDITAEKKLKEEYEFKEAQLQKIYEKSLDALISADDKDKIFEWSPQAEIIFGYTESEIKGKKLRDTIIPHQHREAHDKGMEHFLESGHGPVLNSRIEITALRKSGEEFPIELTIFPMKHDEKHYFTAFVRDISELKASRKSMEKALNKQKELNDLKSQFISMTSHELRTPLTTIRNNTELAQHQLESTKALERKKLLKNVGRINFNVERLNQLINNILMIGQLDSKKIPFNPELIDVCEFIEANILTDFKSRKHEISCSKKGKPYSFNLDKNLFSHILINLIENAIKYTKGPKPPELNLNFKHDHLSLQVKDFGMGIPEEEHDKLFDTFYRAKNVGNVQGSGIGLSIVKEFVNLHKGQIEVESKIGVGTTFNLSFPKN